MKQSTKIIDEKPDQLGLFFDQTRCTGCYACAVACKDWHDIPAGPVSWRKMVTIEKGKYPTPYLAFQGNQCYHCMNAPCLAACPAEAIYKRKEDGIVLVNQEKCLGRDECGHPCSHECPAGNDVVGFISLMQQKSFAEAWKLIMEHNPLPGVTGRICTHPCELKCNRRQVDESVAIHALERFAAEYFSTTPPFRVEWNKQRVAVVGSGPAGLSCAYHLSRCGYRVTIFEALPVIGGMLRVGIPEYRLPQAVLEREIGFIQSIGVEMKPDMRLGGNLTFDELDGYDAVFLAIGCHREKRLPIPGIDMEGVISGIDFLKAIRLDGKVKGAKEIVVLGGGSVAFDCARSALRLGALGVHIICPECNAEMPASPAEIHQGGKEKIIIHASTIASEIMGKNGRANRVKYLHLRSMKFDEHGQLHFDTIQGSEEILTADMVILAIGQDPEVDFLPKNIQVVRGMIQVDETGATTRPKYFAGGDATHLQRKVAWAIGSGSKAAQSIDRLLRGIPKENPCGKTTTVQSELIDSDCIKKKKRITIPILPVKNRLNNFDEVERALNRRQAEREAERCLVCHGMCAVVCPYGAPQFGTENNPQMQKCDFCVEEWKQGKTPICVRSCTIRALDAGPIEQLQAKYGDKTEAQGFIYRQKSKPSIIFKPKFYKQT
jgi:formate dehydrogenase beta subunit